MTRRIARIALCIVLAVTALSVVRVMLSYAQPHENTLRTVDPLRPAANRVEQTEVRTSAQTTAVTRTIGSVTPTMIWLGLRNDLTISGTGAVTPSAVYLRSRHDPFPSFHISSRESLTVTIPLTMPADIYDLLLRYQGESADVPTGITVTVREYTTPTIDSSQQITIYNNKDRTLAIEGRNLRYLDWVQMDSARLKIVDTSSSTVQVLVSKNFTEGTYVLNFGFEHGIVPANAPTVTVEPGINPTMSLTQSWALVNYGEVISDVEVEGKNLKEVQSVFLEGERFGKEACTIQSKEGGKIKLAVPVNRILDRRLERNETYTLRFLFPDDSDLQTSFRIYRSLDPRSSWRSLWLFLLIAVPGASLFIYRRVIQNSAQHIQNQTAPGPFTVAGLCIGTLAAALILGLIVRLFWSGQSAYYSTGQNRFLVVWLLTGTAAVLAVEAAHWTGHFYELWPDAIRYVIALALVVLAVAMPFVLDTADKILSIPGVQAAPWVEAGLVVMVAASWIGASVLVGRALAEERAKGPSDAEIYAEVEQIMWRRGRVWASEDLPDYPLDRVQTALGRYVREHRNEQQLDYLDSPETARLSFQRSDAVREFSDALIELRGLVEMGVGQQSAIRQATNQLAKVVRQHLGFAEGAPFRSGNGAARLSVYSFVSEQLESVLPTPFPFLIFSSGTAISPEEIDQLRRIQNQIGLASRFAVLLPTAAADETRRVIQREMGGLARENIVVLGERDLLNLLVGVQELDVAFMQAVREQIDLVILSPYQTTGPTNADMFFGRTQEIAQVLESIDESSLVVLGARRIGKTSMLRYVSRILEERGNLLLYLDGYFISDYASFFEQIGNSWQPIFPSLDIQSYNSIDEFPRFISDAQALYPEQRIVLQFDEIDRLLWYDSRDNRDERMFRMFRSLAQQQKCQFIFSGERTILDKLHDPLSGFFNFTEPVRLGLLNRNTTHELVRRPMSLVDVRLRNTDEICDLIYEQTSGHPNMVQTVCQMLLRRVQDARTRDVSLDMLHEIMDTPEFKERYLQTFWSQAEPVEKAISIVVCELGSATDNDIRRRLRQAGFRVSMSQIQRGLRYLALSQLLRSVDGKYVIQPQRFLEHLSSLSLDEWLEDFVLDWKDSQREETP